MCVFKRLLALTYQQFNSSSSSPATAVFQSSFLVQPFDLSCDEMVRIARQSCSNRAVVYFDRRYSQHRSLVLSKVDGFQ